MRPTKCDVFNMGRFWYLRLYFQWCSTTVCFNSNIIRISGNEFNPKWVQTFLSVSTLNLLRCMFITATILSDWAKWFDYHNVIQKIRKKVYEVIKPTLSRGILLVIGLSANKSQC